MKTSEVVINVEGLRMRYGTTDVLHEVSFRAYQGEVLCLLGPNGAGKTTTIEIMEGFRMRSAGRVEVVGADPAHGGEDWRARIGIVLQSWRDHGKWRVRELLEHLGRYYAAYTTESLERPWDAEELMAAVGLTEQADHKVKMLSGGQRRRLDVAIGLVGRPEVAFLDEPTAGLDPVARRAFHELIEDLAAEGSTTIVLTTHDLTEAEKLADRILVLDEGRIIADGTAAELARQIAGTDEVRWDRGGQSFQQSTPDATGFTFELFQRFGREIENLEVRRTSLEDTYLSLVHRSESETHAMDTRETKQVAR
ncbi:ABC transporter ATP-binding protein [Nocardia sp. NPDC004278]